MCFSFCLLISCCMFLYRLCFAVSFFFFFKQKTAYEMRISDWSSDVCSSDLKGDTENAPDFRLQAAGHDIGAAWKKTSEAGRPYVSVSLDDPSFPATVYARLIENEDSTHDLIWSRSKPTAA